MRLMKRNISILLVVFLLLVSMPTYADNGNSEIKEPRIDSQESEITALDIKKIYNPLRNESSALYKSSSLDSEVVDFHDESVVIDRVTYYNEQGDVIKEFKDLDALKNLIETENTNIGTKNMSAKDSLIIYGSDFDRRIVDTHIDKGSNIHTIRTGGFPISLDNVSLKKFTVNAGLAFSYPLVSIFASAISEFLPASINYDTGDTVIDEGHILHTKYAELRKAGLTSENNFFRVIGVEKRVVTLKESYYVINSSNGKRTDFVTIHGEVEWNYNPLYHNPDNVLISLALEKWNQYPYKHIYSWDPNKWPYNGKIYTLHPVPTTSNR